MKISTEKYSRYCQISYFSKGSENRTVNYMRYQLVNLIILVKRLSAYVFDIMKLKFIFLLLNFFPSV